MSKTLFIASLLSIPLTALAVPTPPTPVDAPRPPSGPSLASPPPTCSDAGGVLFEIDHDVEPGVEQNAIETSKLVLFEGGRWTFSSSSKRTASGCLAASEMNII